MRRHLHDRQHAGAAVAGGRHRGPDAGVAVAVRRRADAARRLLLVSLHASQEVFLVAFFSHFAVSALNTKSKTDKNGAAGNGDFDLALYIRMRNSIIEGKIPLRPSHAQPL